MIGKLSTTERQYAALVLVMLVAAGIAMAALGRNDTLGAHGLLVILFAGALLYPVLSGFYEPEPADDREASYYDDPIKVGIVLSMAWLFSACLWASGSPHSLPGRTLPSTLPGRRSGGCGRLTHPGSSSVSAETP